MELPKKMNKMTAIKLIRQSNLGPEKKQEVLKGIHAIGLPKSVNIANQVAALVVKAQNQNPQPKQFQQQKKVQAEDIQAK